MKPSEKKKKNPAKMEKEKGKSSTMGKKRWTNGHAKKL